MNAVLAIVGKDLRLRLRDRSVILYGVIAPLVVAIILGGVFSSLDDGLSVRLGVATSGPDANEFIRTALPELREAGLLEAVLLFEDEAGALDAVEDLTVDVAIAFPAVSVAADPTAGPTVIAHGDHPTAAGLARAITTTWVRESATRAMAPGVAAASGADAASVEAIARAVTASAVTTALVDAPVGTLPLDVTTYLSAGMAVFFLLFAVGIAVTGLVEEEQAGTLARMQSTPIPGWAPLLAKALVALIIGVGSMCALVLGTTWIVGASWGGPIGLGLLIVTAVLAATGIVALIASVVRTASAAQQVTAIVATVLGALGGAFFPLRGDLLAVVGFLSPHRWFLQGLTRNAGGAPVGSLMTPLVALLTIALITGSVAAVRMRARMEA